MSNNQKLSCYIRSLGGMTKTLNLNGKKLKEIPKPVCALESIISIEMKNNQIEDLPFCFSRLVCLENLNLGNNKLRKLPDVLKLMTSITRLNFFNNEIELLDKEIFGSLHGVILLNLNHNRITQLPETINRLENLQVLSVCHNNLEELPPEICLLPNLIELRATHNKIENLPLEIGMLQSLKKLYLTRNKLKELPEGITRLNHLSVLDVAANELRIFPTEIQNMALRELYCESNPLLSEIPVHSVQEEEVLSLKELTARFIMKEIKDKTSMLRDGLRSFADARDMLSPASKCAVCDNAFLNTWLECVKFVSSSEIKMSSCSQPVIPVRSLLCSYKCFNQEGHGFYGVAFP